VISLTPAQPAVLQGPNVELAAGVLILRKAEENIAGRLHHLLALYNAAALVPLVPKLCRQDAPARNSALA